MTDSTGIPLTNPAMGPSPTVVGHVEGQAVIIGDHARQQIAGGAAAIAGLMTD